MLRGRGRRRLQPPAALCRERFVALAALHLPTRRAHFERRSCFCVIAGDISPIDVITHVPVLCEDAGVPYIFVPSKDALGSAAQTKRPTSVMLVLAQPLKGGGATGEAAEQFAEEYGKVLAKIKTLG